jgi:hypothetical protein
VEIQSLLADQRAEIDVHRTSEPIKTCESVLLFALNVPERITDVLEVESHTAFEQPGTFAIPVSKEMSVVALTRLIAVRAAKRFS